MRHYEAVAITDVPSFTGGMMGDRGMVGNGGMTNDGGILLMIVETIVQKLYFNRVRRKDEQIRLK